MLHVTNYFDAGDIDKFNESPLGRNKNVYGSKKRFPQLEVNMHLGKTFEAVGGSTGDKEYDNQRFRTTMHDQYDETRVRGGTWVNPKTVWEEMAIQSRKMPIVGGRPRGLLAHEDFGKSKKASSHLKQPKRSVQVSGSHMTSMRKKENTVDTPRSNSKGRVLSLDNEDQRGRIATQPDSEIEVSAFGRYASHRKPRQHKRTERSMPNVPKVSLVDVRYQRELEKKAQGLRQQAERNRSVQIKAPHMNQEFLMMSNKSIYGHQVDLAKQKIARQTHSKDFGLKSLYNNDVTKQHAQMNQTMNQVFAEPLGTSFRDTDTNFDPVHISPNHNQRSAYKLAADQRQRAKNGSGMGALFALNPTSTAYGSDGFHGKNYQTTPGMYQSGQITRKNHIKD